MKRILIVTAVAALAPMVVGCSSTLKAGQLGEGGRFESKSQVSPSDIKIAEPFDKAKFGKLAVVLPFTENNQVNNFYYESIKNSGKFSQVLDKSGVETLVIEKKISGVTDASSILSLHQLSKEIGPFLVVKPYFEYKGGYDFEASLEAMDATTGKVVFRGNKKAFNWAGLDKPLFYPLFNALMDWVDGKTPVSATPTTTTATPPAKDGAG